MDVFEYLQQVLDLLLDLLTFGRPDSYSKYLLAHTQNVFEKYLNHHKYLYLNQVVKASTSEATYVEATVGLLT